MLLLPEDPDASARSRSRTALRERFGKHGRRHPDATRSGRPWREGQTDAAIGAAGLRVVDDLRGTTDASGHLLEATIAAVADEIAGAADLVKGKARGCRWRSCAASATWSPTRTVPGARALVRLGAEDMFAQGSAEAYSQGWKDALREE